MLTNYTLYQSPFSWRYASPEMRAIWSEEHKRMLWRKIWVCLARVQAECGLFSPEILAELEEKQNQINIERSLEIERQIHHDLMAELQCFAEQCPNAGGYLHVGATSMDIEDNAEAIRLKESFDILIRKVNELLALSAQNIRLYADTPTLAFTHLQPAEPTTLGYRLAGFAQDLLFHSQILNKLKNEIRGKGFKGAVGSASSYVELFGIDKFDRFEQRMSTELGVPFFSVTTQTYPRIQDYQVLSSLAGLGSTLYKFAFDLRILQSPLFGEWSEPFSEKQVGSSAMPFKRNPIQAEKIDSLARLLASLPQVAWENASHSLLERTLDDSANRRSILPEAFLITDEILLTSIRILKGLKVNFNVIQRNLQTFAPFSASEQLLMKLVQKGANRQEMHEIIREHSMKAWSAVLSGAPNPLFNLFISDERLIKFLSPEEILACQNIESYTGIAPVRARQLAETIEKYLQEEGVSSP
ncbi:MULTISPECIES: adenylosuccinate lyase [Anaerolinea]|uniref:adenylosuccinate lyase n=1 Tax=Anaerolinea TaxID=233189 RepID=UPI002617AF3F|nr:adenylosuccinate lyase [Anaerolinea thermophila]